MTKLYELISIGAGILTLAWIGYGIYESNVSSPAFTLIEKTAQYEIRKYDTLTLVTHNMRNEDQSFRHLFRYIDGNNATNQKIPMTAPVIEQNNTMMFVMPENLDNPPEPLDPNVNIQKKDNLIVAVKKFKGSSKKAGAKKTSLIQQLISKGKTPSKNWMLCQYNSPWVIPFLRKNEVWIVLD